MSFKLNLNEKCPPIPVDCGESGSFTLFVTWLDSRERAEAVEVLSTLGLAAVAAVVYRKVWGWEGVQNEDATPIPLDTMKDGKPSQENLTRVMGRVPFLSELTAIVKILAINGVKLAGIKAAVQPFMSAGEIDRWSAELDDFLSRTKAAGPAGGSSASSVTAASSAASSDS